MSEEQTPKPVLRDPRGLWGWFRGVMIFYLVLAVTVSALSLSFYAASRGDPFYEPETAPEMFLTLGFVGVAMVSVLAFILCIVFTCRLTYRLMRNLHQIGSPHVTITPRWAVGWYFIPFANLAMPAKAVSEIWRGTFAQIEGEPRDSGGLITTWWACWLLGNITENIASRMLGDTWFSQATTAPSPGMLTAGMVLIGLSTVLNVVAGIFMLRVFGKLTQAQSKMVDTAAFA